MERWRVAITVPLEVMGSIIHSLVVHSRDALTEKNRPTTVLEVVGSIPVPVIVEFL